MTEFHGFDKWLADHGEPEPLPCGCDPDTDADPSGCDECQPPDPSCCECGATGELDKADRCIHCGMIELMSACCEMATDNCEVEFRVGMFSVKAECEFYRYTQRYEYSVRVYSYDARKWNDVATNLATARQVRAALRLAFDIVKADTI